MSASSRLLPLGLIGGGVLLLIVAIASPFVLHSANAAASTSAPIPAQVAGLSLASKSTGSAALQEFTQLHGKSFPVLSGAKAIYGSGNQVILWAAGTASTNEARRLLEEMRDKIAEGADSGRTPFQPTGVRNIANREIYALDGMGQKHFYFQSGKYLVWLAANVDIADQALEQTLDFYK